MSKILKSFGLAALLVALLAGTGMAGDTTTLTGNVIASATVNVLDPDIDFGNFEIGENIQTTLNDSFINVITNHNVTLQAVGVEGDGKMSAGANILGTALKVGIENFGPTTIGGTAATVSGTIVGGTGSDYDGTFVQTVLPIDIAANDYAINVTFSTTAAT